MRHLKTTIIAAAVGLAVAPVAQAELSANIGAVSNYVWRGVTQTDDAAAIQGGLDYAHESGLFVGTWASNVDWGPKTEYDLYGGFSGSAGDFGYKLQYIYYGYLGGENDFGNKPYDFSEIGVSGSYKMFGAGISYTLNGEADDDATFSSGDLYYFGSVTVPLPEDFSLGATVGYYDFDDDADTSYPHTLVTVSKTFGDFGTFGLNLSKAWLGGDDEAALATDDDPRFYVSWLKTF